MGRKTAQYRLALLRVELSVDTRATLQVVCFDVVLQAFVSFLQDPLRVGIV